MPTNVSKPIWVCDICHTSFDHDLAAAERCEAAGHPFVLPDGELLLQYREYWPRAFHLVALHPLDRPGTRASRYNDASGHLARYELEQPSKTSRPRIHDAGWLWPHLPGFLQVNHDAQRRPGSGRGLNHNSPGATGGLAPWPLQRVRLPLAHGRDDLMQYGLGNPRLTAPVTAPVRAVLDMLHAALEPITGYMLQLGDNQFAVLAAEATSRRDGLPPGTYDHNRSAWWLAQTSDDDLLTHINDRQRRWIQGADITVPRPRLRSMFRTTGGYELTASKLTKAQRAIVAATGVDWPPRTTADEYLNMLLTRCLEVTMTEAHEANGHRGAGLFASAPIRVAVTSSKGGVGKTTTAAALALALANAGEVVLLVDLNLPNPGQHTLWNLGPVRTDAPAKLIVPTTVAESTGRLAVFSHGQLAPSDQPHAAVIDVDRAGEWILFLAGALDLRGITAVVFDLPPGWDAVHRHAFDPYVLPLTACVHVTTGHPLAVATETLAGPDSRSPVPRWLVENMSRARGPMTDGSGRLAEIRLYDTRPDAVRNLADRNQINYGGSLPWEPDPRILAGAPEVIALAKALAAAAPQR